MIVLLYRMSQKNEPKALDMAQDLCISDAPMRHRTEALLEGCGSRVRGAEILSFASSHLSM